MAAFTPYIHFKCSLDNSINLSEKHQALALVPAKQFMYILTHTIAHRRFLLPVRRSSTVRVFEKNELSRPRLSLSLSNFLLKNHQNAQLVLTRERTRKNQHVLIIIVAQLRAIHSNNIELGRRHREPINHCIGSNVFGVMSRKIERGQTQCCWQGANGVKCSPNGCKWQTII